MPKLSREYATRGNFEPFRAAKASCLRPDSCLTRSISVSGGLREDGSLRLQHVEGTNLEWREETDYSEVA